MISGLRPLTAQKSEFNSDSTCILIFLIGALIFLYLSQEKSSSKD